MGFNLPISQWLNFPGSESRSPRCEWRADPAQAAAPGQGRRELGARSFPAAPASDPLLTRAQFLLSALFGSGQCLPSQHLCPAGTAREEKGLQHHPSFSRSCRRGVSAHKGVLSSAECQILVLTSLSCRTFGENNRNPNRQDGARKMEMQSSVQHHLGQVPEQQSPLSSEPRAPGCVCVCQLSPG